MKNNRISSMMRSKLLRGGLLALFFVVCVALLSLSGSQVSSQTSTPTQPPPAQNEAKPVTRLIADAKRAGRDFPIVEPFSRQTRSAAADLARSRAVKAGTILPLRPNALADLVHRNSQSLTLRLPTFAGPPVELELVQVNLFAPAFNVLTSDSGGQPVTYERGVHYWGVIKGSENSLAAISVFKDEVMGAFSSVQGGDFVLGKLAGNNPQRDHILYAEKDLNGTIPFSCEMPDYNNAYSPQELEASSSSQVTRCIKVFVEVDYDLFLNKGGFNQTVNYVTGVFNQSAALYSNEGIPISISEMLVWTSPSPYNGAFSQTQLAQFQNTRPDFNGDIAHLVDLQSNQGGVAASLNGLCNPDRSQSMCYSGIDPFYNEVPIYSWTVDVFTHEMGHLFGSPHTHACVWNGNGTAIDGCGPTAGYSEGCNGPIPSNGGTIMSYCHINSVGKNFSLGFGPQPGTVIRNQFNGASCLGTCGAPPTTYYEIVARHSGKCLDVEGESQATGAMVIQWPCGGWFNQQWEIIPVDNGYYKIVARHSGKVLDIQWAALHNGAPAWQWDENGTPAQQWAIINVGGGYVQIIARHSGKALDVSGVSTTDGAQVHQWDYVGGANQQWWLRPIQ